MSRKRKLRKGRACGCLLLLLLVIAALLLFFQGPLFEQAEELLFPRDYEEYVREACAEYGMDPWLIMAMIREESAFDPSAESSAGACGLMQLMPETAEWVIGQAGFSMTLEDALWDPRSNIFVGVWYVHWLDLTYYDGNLPGAAIAAYNAGHSHVDEWLASGAWDGTLAEAENIPYAETRRYVQYVYRSYEIYQKLYD